MLTFDRSSLLILAAYVCIVVPAAAQSNPCGSKPGNPCNPCGAKASNPCNPCGGKGIAMPTIAVNPCHAKHGTPFFVADPMGRDAVTFMSEAPLEDIVGTTNQLVGYAAFDPQRPDAGVRGTFRVPVASLGTGIPLRDEHLRSADWLNAERHPEIVFNIVECRDVKRRQSRGDALTYDMTLVGPITINGRSRTIEAPARITYLAESSQTQSRLPGNLLAIRAEFTVRIRDFGITGGPMGEVIGSKVSETVTLDVRAMGTDIAPSSSAGNPCNPCGGKASNPCNPCGRRGR